MHVVVRIVRILALLQWKTLIEIQNWTLKCLKWRYSTVRSMKNVAVLTEDRASAIFFHPHPRGFDRSRVPTPGNLLSKAKNANARGSVWGWGEGGGGAGRRWNWLMHKMNNNFTLIKIYLPVMKSKRCNTVLVGLGKVQSDRLQHAIYYILRTLFRTKNEIYKSLLNLMVIDTLKHRRYYQALMLIYKCLYSIGPKYIADFLN